MLGGNRYWVFLPFAMIVFAGLIDNVAAFELINSHYQRSKPLIWFFSLFYTLSLAFATDFNTALYQSLKWLCAIGVFYVVSCLKPMYQKILVDGILISATVHAMAAILMSFGLLPHPEWNPTNYVAGFFKNHNHLGALMSVSLCWSFHRLKQTERPKNKTMLAVAMGVQLWALLLCNSRGAWVAAALSSLWLWKGISLTRSTAVKIGITLITICILVLISGLVLPGFAHRFKSLFYFFEDDSFLSRFKIWSGTLAMIQNNFLFGVGPGNFANTYSFFRPEGLPGFINHAHNDFLELIAETGLPCFAIIIVWVSRLLKNCFQRRFLESDQMIKLILLTYFLIHSMIDYPLQIPCLLFFLITLFAINTKNESLSL